MRDSFAAKRLLYRRLRCLANYETANRNLEKARAKNKDIHAVSTDDKYTLFQALIKLIHMAFCIRICAIFLKICCFYIIKFQALGKGSVAA